MNQCVSSAGQLSAVCHLRALGNEIKQFKCPLSEVAAFDMLYLNIVVLPFRDQCWPHDAHADVSCLWIRDILGNLSMEGDGESFQ